MSNYDEYFVIADIHGRYDLLLKAFEAIRERTLVRSNVTEIIFLGDYVDRGPHSGLVIDWLMKATAGEFAPYVVKCLKGNHEDMLVYDYLESGILYDPDILASFKGGMISDKQLNWMKNLPLYHIQDKNIFVHAAWDATKMPDEQPIHRLFNGQSYHAMLWQRYSDEEPFNSADWFLTHGHTPRVHGPIRAYNRINLDTKAYSSGRLVVGVYKYGIMGPTDFIEVKA